MRIIEAFGFNGKIEVMPCQEMQDLSKHNAELIEENYKLYEQLEAARMQIKEYEDALERMRQMGDHGCANYDIPNEVLEKYGGKK